LVVPNPPAAAATLPPLPPLLALLAGPVPPRAALGLLAAVALVVDVDLVHYCSF